MKHFAGLLALAMVPTVVQADVTVYGKGDVALQYVDRSGEETAELVDNSSRIGLKGSETLTDGLEAIYQFEYGTYVDDGDSDGRTLGQRNIYIGLRGDWGSLLAGKVDTPLKRVQNKVDLFNDLEGDIGYLFAGEVRASNTVQYRSPVLAESLSGSVAYITYEEEGVDPGVSASGSFQRGAFYLGAALDSNVAMPDSEAARLAARVSIASIHLGALVEHYEDNQVEEDGALVSVLWELTEAWSLKAQGGVSDINYSGGESLSLGVDYHFSDNTKVYGYYTNETNDLGCAGQGCDDDYLGAGLSLSF